MEVGEAREAIVKEALNRRVRYIWFVDDDTVPPSHACRALVQELEKHGEVGACGGIYVDKNEVPTPLIFREWGDGAVLTWAPGEVFPVKGIATGCLMVRASVFESLPEPWFRTISEVPEDGSANRLTMTDDMWFCKRLEAAGLQILAHGGVLCDHYDLTTGKVYRPAP
jgi:cellulose synthase/poly-beta-1,6-N-acetylglucosamine synthase-like glycosyltransferase